MLSYFKQDENKLCCGKYNNTLQAATDEKSYAAPECDARKAR